MNLLSFLFVPLVRQGAASFISLTAPFICIVFLIFGSDRASGQQEWTWGLLATRIAQEKAKVVSYRVLIHRKQLEGKGYTDIKWLREFSEIGNHNISAIFDFGTDNSSRMKTNVWDINGCSGNRTFFGNDVIYSRLREEGEKPDLGVEHFDWRTPGIGFCGDLHEPFEEVLSGFASWGDDGEKPLVSVKSPGVFEFATGPAWNDQGCLVEVEVKDGVRVKSLLQGDFKEKKDKTPVDGVKWDIEYAKVQGIDLPSKATITCVSNRSKDGIRRINRLQFDFKWLSVNEPIETGLATAKRLTSELYPKKP